METVPTTKADIVDNIANKTGCTYNQVRSVVDLTFDHIIDTLNKDRRFELRNFGIFEVKERKARAGRNPKTNEQLQIPAKQVVVFKPSKQMRTKVNQKPD